MYLYILLFIYFLNLFLQVILHFILMDHFLYISMISLKKSDTQYDSLFLFSKENLVKEKSRNKINVPVASMP